MPSCYQSKLWECRYRAPSRGALGAASQQGQPVGKHLCCSGAGNTELGSGRGTNWRCCASLVLCGCRAGVGIPEQVSARGSLGQCPAQGLLTHSQLLQPPELCCHPAGPAEARECSAALGKNPSFLHLDVVVALSSAFLDCANPSPWEGRSWSGAGDTGISAAAGFPSLSLPVGTGTHTRSRC